LSLKLRADRSLVRCDARSLRHVSVELRAPEAPLREDRLAVNLAFVIDRSGSMHGDKITHARNAVVQGIRSLREGDRFTVVTYHDTVDLVVPSTTVTSESREAAVKTVRRITTGASTDLHGGWRKGCEQVAEQLGDKDVGRCLLLTDGLANVGLKDHDEIVRQCAGWRDRRVVTSSFGIGADFDETLLRRMSDAGGGNFQFIESAAQIADFVASEVGEALATTVREAVLLVDAGEGAVVESLNDFPCRQEGGSWRVAVGSLYSGQSLTPVLRIRFPEGVAGHTRDVSVRALDQDSALGRASGSLRFTWAAQSESDAQPRDRSVDRLAAALYAARAERDALELNRKGDYAAARKVIETCLAHVQEYAGDDPVLFPIVVDLQNKARQYGRGMDSLASKSHYSMSSQVLRGRLSSRLSAAKADVEAVLRQLFSQLAAADPDLVRDLDLQTLPARLAHSEPRGCLFDPSRSPTDTLEIKLRASDLCSPCRSALESAGVPAERLQRIVDALRLMGVSGGVVH
jgi:Ca-activated chloride channel homolog